MVNDITPLLLEAKKKFYIQMNLKRHVTLDKNTLYLYCTSFMERLSGVKCQSPLLMIRSTLKDQQKKMLIKGLFNITTYLFQMDILYLGGLLKETNTGLLAGQCLGPSR